MCEEKNVKNIMEANQQLHHHSMYNPPVSFLQWNLGGLFSAIPQSHVFAKMVLTTIQKHL
jgi:hypothetical protein